VATYHQQLQSIFQKYTKEVSADPADLQTVGQRAIQNGLWHPRPADMTARFASEMADALREEYRIDGANRKYRAKHAVRKRDGGRQQSFWADIDIAPREHMVQAFGQRRKQIVGDCHQLRVDVDHYNSVREDETDIQLVLDFTEDVEEMLIAEGIEEDAA
jgi:hypothetical protein